MNIDPESLAGGDRAVGEEETQRDVGMRDLTQYLQGYKKQYGDSEDAGIDWARISNVGLIGGLFGATFPTLIYNHNKRSKSYFFWGVILGGLAASVIMYLVLLVKQLRAEADTGYEKEMAEREAALRRKEQEVFERHDEFVYYDAAKQHSCLFKFFYCPHYGKITSERIIYSEQTPFPTFESGCLSFLPSCGFLRNACAWPWAKKVHSMDIDTVLDAGVEQSCVGYVNNSGTVVISVNARADASAITEQRDKLRLALQQRSLPKLREAMDGCGGMTELKVEFKHAKVLADELADAAGEAPGAEWAAASKGNSLTRLNVLSVTNPYAVLDDLSYKITKNRGQKNAKNMRERSMGGFVVDDGEAKEEEDDDDESTEKFRDAYGDNGNGGEWIERESLLLVEGNTSEQKRKRAPSSSSSSSSSDLSASFDSAETSSSATPPPEPFAAASDNRNNHRADTSISGATSFITTAASSSYPSSPPLVGMGRGKGRGKGKGQGKGKGKGKGVTVSTGLQPKMKLARVAAKMKLARVAGRRQVKGRVVAVAATSTEL